MISVPTFDIRGSRLDPVEVDESVLGGRVRISLLREAVQMYEMNRHVCTKGHLSRGEVAGTTRKMYRQKHTGSARAGQKTVPHRRGGGLTFAVNTRDISYHIPQKARRNATRSALLARLLDHEVSLVHGLKLDAPRTKTIAEMLEALGLSGRNLLIVDGDDNNLWKSGRNLPNLAVQRAADINAYDLLKPDHVLFTRTAFQRVLEALGT